MFNHAPLFLALRYLRPKRSFVSVITIISILGVAVGVLAMVVVRAVMTGFEADFRATLIGSLPHVLVSRADPPPPDASPWPKVLEKARQQAGVVSASPFAGGILYLANGDLQTGAHAMGLNPADAQAHLKKMQEHLLAGSLDLADGTVVISDQEANDIGVLIGDEISVYADKNVNEAVREYTEAEDEDDAEKRKARRSAIRLHPLKLRVAGVLDTSRTGHVAYVSLKTGQELFKLGDQVTGIAMELQNPEAAAPQADLIRASAPGWTTKLWTDDNQGRLAAMKNEQVMMQLLLSIIAVVAAFSVMNTTITVTTQKRREIGVLAALGCGWPQITGVFFLQALIVGVLGTALGLGLSLLVLWMRDDIRGWIAQFLGGEVSEGAGVFLAQIPAVIHPLDVAFTCGVSLTLCVLAGLIPSLLAAAVEPAEALRD